jgi:hypothetical protein
MRTPYETSRSPDKQLTDTIWQSGLSSIVGLWSGVPQNSFLALSIPHKKKTLYPESLRAGLRSTNPVEKVLCGL